MINTGNISKTINSLIKIRSLSLLIAGFICGLLAGYVLFYTPTILTPSEYADNGKIKAPIVKTISKSAEEFTISTQIPGPVAIVDNLQMKQDGWIAVHDDTNGQPGKILGANYYKIGTYQNAKIPLLRSMEDGQSYILVLHTDNGDGYFDYKIDIPLLSDSGAISSQIFTTEALSSRGD